MTTRRRFLQAITLRFVPGPHSPTFPPVTQQRAGALSALTAFSLWGVFPVFWKQLAFLPAPDIVAYRTIWSLAFLLLILTVRRELRPLASALSSKKTVLWLFVSGSLLAANWILYVWATVNGHILEGALGYYLTPFLNMLCGALFYAERNNRLQVAAIAIALTGVAIQIPTVGHFPWIALSLALTFSIYGLCKKAAPLDSRMGITAETLLLVPAAILWLTLRPAPESAAAGFSPGQWLLIAGTGLATTLPLLFFGHAVRHIRLTTIGIIQFIAPTLQFLSGWLIYGEPLGNARLFSFILIWTAIAIYAAGAVRHRPQS